MINFIKKTGLYKSEARPPKLLHIYIKMVTIEEDSCDFCKGNHQMKIFLYNQVPPQGV